ncbi:MAG TPA: S49 family peptidase [Pirellulales bacterium]|nr:S49 family peptidase [Pirellulales bacterium]
MLRRLILCCLVALTCFGCKHPMQVMTTSRIITEMPPVSNARRVVAMPLRSTGGSGAARIALIDVDGMLLNMDMTGFCSAGENPVSLFRERLDAAAADPCVRAVVVRINSPGGGVTATDMMWHDLEAFKARTGRPVVACLLDVATGGAYYLATAADQIVAHPTTVTGGIGVIINLYNLQDAMAQFNVVANPVKSGVNVDLGSPIRAQEPEERELLQTISDQFHARFKQIVEQARPAHDPSRMEDFDGRIFTASQAHERKLIDSIGYLDDAIELARRMSNCPQAQVALYHRPNDPARTPYAVTPNVPLQQTLIPLSIPGFDRSRLPTFLYLWQPDPTLEKQGGR